MSWGKTHISAIFITDKECVQGLATLISLLIVSFAKVHKTPVLDNIVKDRLSIQYGFVGHFVSDLCGVPAPQRTCLGAWPFDGPAK